MTHSQLRPHFVASASDNGTVRLWAGRGLADCAASLTPAQGSPVCGAAFSTLNEHLLAAACADTNAYVFDLRQLSSPLHVRSCLVSGNECNGHCNHWFAAGGGYIVCHWHACIDRTEGASSLLAGYQGLARGCCPF